jgi:hypothetical protein
MNGTGELSPFNPLMSDTDPKCAKRLGEEIDGRHVLDLQCDLKPSGYGDIGESLVKSDPGDKVTLPCKVGDCAVKLILNNNANRAKVESDLG